MVLALEQRLQACKRAPLADPPPVVLVDGMWVKIAYPTGDVKVEAHGRRRAAKRKQKRVVLTALGVWPDGHWEILHWKIAAAENGRGLGRMLRRALRQGGHRRHHSVGGQ